LIEKENQLLLLSKGEICWILGKMIDDRFKISENTKHVLNLAVQPTTI
jgi:tRNA(Ile)-lysidine synthase